MQKNFILNKKALEVAKTIRVLCGPTRFKIVVLLRKHKGGLTVTELAHALNASLSRISHQLKILKKNNLVEGTGKNRETLYKLADHRLHNYLNSILK